MQKAGKTVGRHCSRAIALGIAAGFLAMDLMAATAWAQKQGRVPNEDGGWLQWGIAAGLVVVVCVPAFLNPKRSHLT